VYVTPAQMTGYYDSRRILQLVLDDGTDATAADLSNPASAAYKMLVVLIRAAESEIDAALQVGQRYSRLDLEALVTAADSVTATEEDKKRLAILNRLTADLVFGALLCRRAFSAAQIEDLCPRYGAAQEMLAKLGDGSAIFDLDAPKNAGIPHAVRLGSQIDNTIRNSRLFGVFGTASPPGGFFYA